MSRAIYESISETFGFEPIMINSALVSAQNRQRYYWVGKRNDDGTYSKVDIEQPEDRGILLKDVLDGIALKDKQNCIDANYYKGGNYSNPNKQSGQRMCAAEPVSITKDGKSFCLTARYYKGVGNNPGIIFDKHRDSMAAEPVGMAQRGRYNGNCTEQHFEAREDGKSNCVTTVQKDCLVGEPVNTTDDGKSQCLRATCYKDGIRNLIANDVDRRTAVAEPVRCFTLPRGDGIQTQSKQYRVYDVDGKSTTLCAEGGGMGAKTGLYAAPIEFQDLIIRSNAHIAINNNAIRGVQNKNNASCAENFYEFTDTKANTLTTAHRPKIIDELSNYKYYGEACEWNDNGEPTKAISFADGKKYTVYTVKDGQITIKEKQYPIKLQDGYYIIRKLTVSECKRLQTVPEWYEFPVSDTQAYKMLGNGWTVDVIAHLIEATMV